MSVPAVRVSAACRSAWSVAAAIALGGCAGEQSALAPFGVEAEALRTLSIAMFSAAALLTAGVLALARHAVRSDAGISDRCGMRLVLWLGAVGPAVLLSALLVTALPMMRPLEAAPDAAAVEVHGEQFWWRVVYVLPGGERVETANEVALPVGRRIAFALESPDVIHSFWVPGLAGKVDMIPGRVNRLVAEAARPGTYRGVCAELCGLGHARMAFDVLALDAAAFEAWLNARARPAADARGPGRVLFGEYGCAGCHVVRGHFEGTPIGPDLTHVAARASLAAGTLPMSAESLARFIRDPQSIKPGAWMPAFRDMPAEDAEAIAAYLAELR